MVSKAFSFRLSDAAVQALEAMQLDGETLNQTAQRFVLQQLGLSTETPQSVSTALQTSVDIKELVKQEIETNLAELRSQLEELRGKLKAR